MEVAADQEESLNECFRKYLAGNLMLGPNEVHQFGFRLAAALGHERLYAVDWMEWTGTRSVGEVYRWAQQNQADLFESIRETSEWAQSSLAPATKSVLELLRTCNHPEYVMRTHQMYVNLARVAQGTDYVGLGWLRWWYERNLAVFANVSRIVAPIGDRVLIMFGAAHTHLIAQFLRESGMFKVEMGFDYL